MAYNILGVNISHDSSICLLSNGKIITYLEEERLSRIKKDAVPYKILLEILSNYNIDEIVISGLNISSEYGFLPFSEEEPISGFIRKFCKNNPKITFYREDHHFFHAISSFVNSKFKEAISVVIDGAGSTIYDTQSPKSFKIELESSFIFTDKHFEELNREYYFGNNDIGLCKTYEIFTEYLGFIRHEAGKLMGLSSYGKKDSLIPLIYLKNKANPELFKSVKGEIPEINYNRYPYLKSLLKSKEWHHNPSLITNLEKNIAYHVQQESQEAVKNYIEFLINKTNIKNICCSGGYFLNCVSNYNLKKEFPDVNFYFEPIAHDGGTAIGVAYYAWYIKNNKYPLSSTTLYLGPLYKKSKLKKVIKKYNSMFKQYKTTPKQIAKLISERNIVTMFQGRSEAGPRALGNRSILYDPTDPNGKDFVNKIKKREWFRPFAGTVLLEKANEYFDMAGLKESPFMMYAMDVWPNKQKIIPAITHVDGTCRIQTVTEEQNLHYYKLIQEFEKITGVPILFNTSFNLAGDPLVETIEDALETILKSDLKYLYLPELEILLEKN